MTTNVQLPKWPALVVVGKSVTPDQAKEILIRTSSYYLSCNDEAWNRIVHKAFGFKPDPRGVMNADFDSIQEVRTSLGVLDLEYLSNHMIASCYVDGPHGWCNWNGEIGCNSFNIGKWPDVATVRTEWKKIAEAFPFLDLRAQLFSGEHCEELTEPLIEYRVAKGRVRMTIPKTRLASPRNTELDLDAIINQKPGRERGCSEQTLREALYLVRLKMNSLTTANNH